MNFQELADTLPNGFHDAEIQRFDMDFVHRTLRFDLIVWIGRMDDAGARELYRPARLTLDKVAFIVIEPPDENYPWLEMGTIRIDAGEGQPQQSSSSIPSTPSGSSVSWMYLNEINSFLLFAAEDAALEWIGPEENRASWN